MNQLESIDLKAFAARVLFGKSMDEKLSVPSRLDIAAPTLFQTPDYPGRPSGLEINPHKRRSSQHTFPTKSSLDEDRSRGLVLHFFANHELLALEIMALAILKFDDAPEKFLRGIAQTMLEEQQHMTLYISRMKELGVTFGEAGLNGFFWNSLKDISSPQEYVAAMSLTFEQANLDFSLKFEQEFLKLGDHKTSEILERVRREEIGHVKHGVIWLDRWKKAGRSLWEEYQSHLRFPLTPARGKGPTFDREGRKAAGLSAEFIDEMEVFSASKGRPPRVFWFNPACEDELFLSAAKQTSNSQTKVVDDLTSDLAPLMSYLSKQDDVVFTPTKPTQDWLRQQKQAGFEVPEFLEVPQNLRPTLPERKLSGLEPWGWSSRSRHALQPLMKQLVTGSKTPPTIQEVAKPSHTHVFSKTLAARLRTLDDLPAILCSSLEELTELQTSRAFTDTSHMVVKSPYGSSGRNTVLLPTTPTALTIPQKNWLSEQFQSYGDLLVEPWVDRLADLSLQCDLSTDGKVTLLGVTRFLVNRRGQYIGHLSGKLLEGLPQEVATAWHASQTGWLKRFEESASCAGHELAKLGYHGPFGIDGFIYRKDDAYQFQSLGEINPRYTMGRVFLEITKHCIVKSPGLWLHLRKSDLKKFGADSFTEFAEQMRVRCPLHIREFSVENRKLQSGVYFTTPPENARQILTMLLLVEDAEELPRILEEFGVGS